MQLPLVSFIVIGLTASVSVASAGSITFADNFNPPASLWTNTTGNWTATGGQYYAQQPNNNPGAVTFLPLNVSDYTLNLTVNGLGDGGVVVRTNSTDTQDVILILGGLGYGQGVRNSTAGTAAYWADSANPSGTINLVTGVFIPGDTYQIRITAVGNTFSLFVNGSSTPVTTFTDSIAGSSGGIGLYDDQPNTTTGSGFGTPTSFSGLALTGTSPTAVPEPNAGFLMIGAGLTLAWFLRRSYRKI